MEPPKEPVLFFKATSAIVGPNDNIIIPKGSVKTDWEVELKLSFFRQKQLDSFKKYSQYSFTLTEKDLQKLSL